MIREQRRLGRTVIGQFGSIYPQKNCAELLNIARILLAGGHDVAVAFIGSFIKAMDDVEADFHRQVEQHGLAGRVLVTGYVGTDREVFAAFREVDVFCYRFTEGLTSRRGSVLAAAASGRTVVTNAPRDPDSLAHHGLFQTLIAGGNIVTCPTDADAGAMAAAVARAIGNGPPASQDFEAEVDKLWQAVIERLDEVQR
jgi:glycosyltransferase involved in cell wall biosynthesis